MNPIDDQLRRALRRVEPPPGFVERTLARAAAERPAARRGGRWMPAFAAVAASLALVVGGLQYQQYRRGQEAKEQLLLALQITGTQLSEVQSKLSTNRAEK